MADFNIEWHVQFTEDGNAGFYWSAKGTEMRNGVRVNNADVTHGERSDEGRRFENVYIAEEDARVKLYKVTQEKKAAHRKNKGVVFVL